MKATLLNLDDTTREVDGLGFKLRVQDVTHVLLLHQWSDKATWTVSHVATGRCFPWVGASLSRPQADALADAQAYILDLVKSTGETEFNNTLAGYTRVGLDNVAST